MIFVQLFFDNFCDNFFSHIHIMFLLSFSVALVFISITISFCKLMVVSKVVTKMIVHNTSLPEITLLLSYD